MQKAKEARTVGILVGTLGAGTVMSDVDVWVCRCVGGGWVGVGAGVGGKGDCVHAKTNLTPSVQLTV